MSATPVRRLDIESSSVRPIVDPKNSAEGVSKQIIQYGKSTDLMQKCDDYPWMTRSAIAEKQTNDTMNLTSIP